MRLFPFWTAWLYALHAMMVNFSEAPVPVCGIVWLYMGILLALLPVFRKSRTRG